MEMCDETYWVWLQQAFGEGSRKIPLIVEYFGSARAFYESDNIEKRMFGMLTPNEIARAEDTPLDIAVEILEACQRLNYLVLTPESSNYPDRLRNLDDYPAALYICGELPDIDNEVCIAMVGTRRASRYGYNAALSLAQNLAACGATVISGCARGIDTAAHNGALIGGGKTLAVLGCGINTRYNMENEGLRKVISANGALISEYPPGSPPLSYHFPIRNRLISALSLGVIVVEAGAKSGSLITANLALEQGKDIFSVPGEISNDQAKGTNRLIFDGAKPIESAYDVLEEYIVRYPDKLNLGNMRGGARKFDKGVRPKWEREASVKTKVSRGSLRREEKEPTAPKISSANAAAPKAKRLKYIQPAAEEDASKQYPVGMSSAAINVAEALGASPKSAQELIDALSLSASQLMTCITELELYGMVNTLPGKRYTRR